jgi:hypothetical protein
MTDTSACFGGRMGDPTIDAPERIRPVFVVGCPRSGTTLVGELIAAHPGVFNGEESFFLYLLRNWEAMLRPPVAPLTSRFLESAQRLMQTLISTETLALGKTYYLDHTPWHAFCLDQLWALFPKAQVIHVVRHPADVTASLGHSYRAGFRWAGRTVAARARLWKDFVLAIRQYEEDPRLRTVRYEDLCSSPVSHAQAIYRWLDLEWDDRHVNVFARPHAANSGRPFVLASGEWPSLSFKQRPIRRVPEGTARALTTIGADIDATRFGYDIATTLVAPQSGASASGVRFLH